MTDTCTKHGTTLQPVALHGMKVDDNVVFCMECAIEAGPIDLTQVERFQYRKVIQKSAISFEYPRNMNHLEIVQLLRAAILNADLCAIMMLNAKVTDIRGA